MPKPSSLESALDSLVALRAAPSAEGVRDALAKGLASKSNIIAAKAASLIAEFARDDLAPQLVATFNRFLPDPKSDKGCAATTAAARALLDTDERGDADGARRVFLAGIRHVQREGSYGPPVDVAAQLRGVCALGLVKIAYPHAMLEVADLLGDPEPLARLGAAQALGHSGRDEAALLLRFKLASGDPEPDVMAECMTALMRLGQRWGVEYVSRFLDDPDSDIRGAAAIAMGESRQGDALEPLLVRLRREVETDVRRQLMLGVAMLRTPESRDALLKFVTTGKVADAVDAIEALAIFRHHPAIRAQVEAAVMPRNDPAIIRPFRAAFPG